MVVRKSAGSSNLEIILRPRGFEMFTSGDADEKDVILIESFKGDKYRALYELGFQVADPDRSQSLQFIQRISSSFIYALSRMPDIENDRGNTPMPQCDFDSVASTVPFIPGSEYVNGAWVRDIWERLLKIFSSDISTFEGTVEYYLAGKNENLQTPGRIFFHLVERPPSDVCPFAFMATYSPESPDGKRRPHVPLKYALDEYRDDRVKMLQLLSGLGKIADRSELISGLMDSGELFHPIYFEPDEAYTFLKEVPLYEECGVLCRIPNWCRNSKGFSISMKLSGRTAVLDRDSILSCEPALEIDGVPITPDEVEQLLKVSEGLALFKGKWVEVTHSRLQKALEKLEKLKAEYGEGLTVAEAMRLSAGVSSGDEDLQDVTVTRSDWIKKFIDNVRNPRTVKVLPPTFKGSLRPYQENGFGWLDQMSDLGFGACLADDMGLGKTVQTLAFLETRRGEGRRSLLVAPASLIGNWQKEALKFVPEMKVGVIRGPEDTSAGADLVLTTYGTLTRRKNLQDTEWDSVILDEAQNIKNANTKQSQAARSIKGRFRLALTGTPVENDISDLWSIFDFTNRGFLGTFSEFSRFAGDLDKSGGYGRLREMIAPFVLRRLKTDKKIIQDLPEKIEKNEYVSLSKKQIVLYREFISNLNMLLQNCDHKGRSAVILSAITKLKQICNHPDQYLGQDVFAEGDSGKFEMLVELAQSIRDKRERVLVFTQYREMTEPLSKLLAGVFGREGLVLHGGVSAKERTSLVSRFNSEDEYIPYMVLSLKAGGVGLNLTAANHVIHFDRWWNPAVENQATDRAFRIGQKKEVMVHKFVCTGTMEEKIDQMINDKTELSEQIVGKGEAWISKMSDSEIMSLFRLDV